MNSADWIFLTELLVVIGSWVLLCAWNDQFSAKKTLEDAAQGMIMRKYKENLTHAQAIKPSSI
jgi:hypothetical protein